MTYEDSSAREPSPAEMRSAKMPWWLVLVVVYVPIAGLYVHMFVRTWVVVFVMVKQECPTQG